MARPNCGWHLCDLGCHSLPQLAGPGDIEPLRRGGWLDYCRSGGSAGTAQPRPVHPEPALRLLTACTGVGAADGCLTAGNGLRLSSHYPADDTASLARLRLRSSLAVPRRTHHGQRRIHGSSSRISPDRACIRSKPERFRGRSRFLSGHRPWSESMASSFHSQIPGLRKYGRGPEPSAPFCLTLPNPTRDTNAFSRFQRRTYGSNARTATDTLSVVPTSYHGSNASSHAFNSSPNAVLLIRKLTPYPSNAFSWPERRTPTPYSRYQRPQRLQRWFLFQVPLPETGAKLLNAQGGPALDSAAMRQPNLAMCRTSPTQGEKKQVSQLSAASTMCAP